MKDQFTGIINHLQHVGIPVTDMAVSEAFYARLGFENIMRSLFTVDGETGICIMMKNKSVVIELYQLPGKQLDEIRKIKNGHIDHIAFDVDDIDVTFSLLKNASFDILENTPVFLSFWEKGCRYFNISGPDGERLEFNQVIK